jgi:hypothetical protein
VDIHPWQSKDLKDKKSSSNQEEELISQTVLTSLVQDILKGSRQREDKEKIEDEEEMINLSEHSA